MFECCSSALINIQGSSTAQHVEIKLFPLTTGVQTLIFLMAFSILASPGISPWFLNMCGNPASLSVAVVKNHEFIVSQCLWNREADSILEGPGRWACREQHGPWKHSPLSSA